MAGAYFDWTPEREEKLRRLWVEEGNSAGVIARLWGITRNAVIGKVHRRGWQRSTSGNSPSAPALRLRAGEGDQHKRRPLRKKPMPSLEDLTVERLRPRAKRLDEVAAKLGITVGELKERRLARRERAQAAKVKAQVGANYAKLRQKSFAPQKSAKIAGPLTLLELRVDSCRFILGDVAGPRTLFCGRLQAAEGGSYCTEHRERCVSRPRAA